jgi:hypothetical protein
LSVWQGSSKEVGPVIKLQRGMLIKRELIENGRSIKEAATGSTLLIDFDLAIHLFRKKSDLLLFASFISIGFRKFENAVDVYFFFLKF